MFVLETVNLCMDAMLLPKIIVEGVFFQDLTGAILAPLGNLKYEILELPKGAFVAFVRI